MDASAAETLRRIVKSTSVGALGTVGPNGPLVSMVPVALDSGRLIIHISGLAAHTGQLRADPRASLMMMEPQSPGSNALALPRITFETEARELESGTADYERAKELYLKCHSNAEMLFGFGDFTLVSLLIKGGRFVAGFGAAFDVSPDEIDKALRER